jgi:hypothetical protein
MQISRSFRLRLTRFAVLAAALALTTQAALASAEGKFDRTLTVNGPVTLAVGTGSGDIHVTPGSDGTVTIHARVRVNGWLSGGDAEARVKQVVDNPPIEQAGNIIRIGKKDENNWGGHNHVSIDYEITAPRQTALSASTGSGNVRANGFTGDFKANSGSGDLELADMAGNGNMSTGSGNIRVKDLSGVAKLDTGSGDIELGQHTRAEVQARTGSGNIRLDNVQDAVRAQTGSGDLNVSGTPNAGWRLGTGSGNVDVTPAHGSKFDLDASSGSGGIHSDQPITMQGSLDRHHMHGTVNGGGPTVYIETGSGSVHIH